MEMCRLRVVCDRVTADVAVPVDLPVLDLLPDLVDLVTPASNGSGTAGPRTWQLVHPVRGPLAEETTLAAAGLVDGATLLLDAAADAGAPTIVEDVAEAVGEALGARTERVGRPLARWVGAAVLAAAAVALTATGPPSEGAGALAAVVGVFCSLAGGSIGRLREHRAAGTALAAAGVPWWGAAGAALAATDRPSLAMGALAAAGMAAGSLAALATPGTVRVAPGAFLGSAAVAAQLALFDEAGDDAAVAAVAAIALIGLLVLLPRAAVAASGLGFLNDGTATDKMVTQRVATGRALQERAAGGLLLALAPAVAVLAVADEPEATILLVALAGVLASRARRTPYPKEVIPAAVAAALVGVATSTAVSAFHPGAGRALAVGGLAVAGTVVLAASAFPERPRPITRRAADAVHLALAATMVVAGLATAGVFAAVADLGG